MRESLLPVKFIRTNGPLKTEHMAHSNKFKWTKKTEQNPENGHSVKQRSMKYREDYLTNIPIRYSTQ